MKKIISTLLVVIGFATVSFSQTEAAVANSAGKTALEASKTSGQYSFTLPESATPESVAKNAGYYTDYFTVAYDEASRVANISMVYNEPQSRIIIARFLSASGAREVEIDGVNYSIGDFIQNYLN